MPLHARELADTMGRCHMQSWKIPPHIPYAGRGPSASPAAGFSSVHADEQRQLVADALNLVGPPSLHLRALLHPGAFRGESSCQPCSGVITNAAVTGLHLRQ